MNRNQNDPAMQQENDSIVPEEELYTVVVDGEEIALTLEQLIQAAQDGLSRANQTARTGNVTGSVPGGDVYQSFMTEYPDVRPTDIPQEVWDMANRTGDLLGSYRAYEISKLREELAAYRKNEENRKMNVGSAQTDGESSILDPIVAALLGRD
ncbi:MAG: hypothetical protein ACI4PQ_03010 [Butyricicoccaceae bacterium]